MTREEAIRILSTRDNQGMPVTWQKGFLEAYEMAIEVLQEQKIGKWIHGREIAREMIGDCITAIFYEGWKCSECECVVEEERESLWNYCPNCGADMRGNKHETD